MNPTVKVLIGIAFVAVIGFGIWIVPRSIPIGILTGTVSYAEKAELPAGSTVEINLIDVSNTGVDSIILARQIITTAGEESPFKFSLEYNPSAVKAEGDYSVGARIRVNGSVWWTSTTNLLVLTKGHATSSVDVKLVNVR
jgi:putative lipoprotein